MGVSTDTRTLQPGQLFIALIGEKHDGHDFLAQAFEKGAAAALVSRAPAEPVEGTLLLVENTLRALGQLAAGWRRKYDIPVIAVTGSVGKTTTKEMIASILSQAGKVLKNQTNFNNEIGVPLTALLLDATHQAAVFELAMRGKGQIRYLAEIVAPNVGVITNIGISHLELLKTPAAIAETKAELLDVVGSTGIAVLPQESEYFQFLRAKAKQALSFGLTAGDINTADIRLEGEMVIFRLWLPQEYPRLGSAETAVSGGGWHPVRLPVPGRHNVLNAAAAAAAALSVGATPEQIVRGLEAFQPVVGRTRVVKAPGGFTVIDDTYNASPDSMRAALSVLADMEGARKIAVLGDMRELGEESEASHRAIGRQAAAISMSLLITVGELGKEIAVGAADAQSPAGIASVPDAQAALEFLKGRVQEGDIVLVKASRALGLEAVVEGLLADG